MSLKDYLNFFRWKNILMILLIQYLFKYVLFEKLSIEVSLDHIHFGLLALSTAFVAIAGYIINDINDVKADIINKPQKLFVDKKITRIDAQKLFIAFNSAGLLLGMYLSYHINHTSYFMIYILTSLLLYMYAMYLKKRFLIGNIIISFIVFFCIMMVAVFDVAPATNLYNIESQQRMFDLFFLFAGFGFSLTFVREIVKDIEDIEGDKVIKAKSFPIVIGMKKTKILLIATAILLVLALGYISFSIYEGHRYVSFYLILLVTLPLLYFIFKLIRAREKNDFHTLSGILKIIMLLGILSIFVI